MKIVKTLAEFVSTTRENIGLSQKGLAMKANVPLEVIENIEAGKDLFMATTIRQKIARALKAEIVTLKALEKHPKNYVEVPLEVIENIKRNILAGNRTGNKCPVCKSELICRVAQMYDLEDNLVSHAKARCSQCPFQLKT